jgi:TRAP-type C4-dicarboxylate transport system substrate-binding protein
MIFREAAKQSSQYMREQWLDWEKRSERQAIESGVTVISNVNRKPFEDSTKPLRDTMRADPRFRSLIERIEAVR